LTNGRTSTRHESFGRQALGRGGPLARSDAMSHAGFETVNGKQIFFIDFRDAPVAASLKTIADAKAQVARCQPNSLLTLTDVTNAVYDEVVAEKLKELAAANKPFVKASAVVGVAGLKKVVFNMVILFTRRKMSLFDDLAAARKWLATQ
jgi:hypothetical protein